MASKKNLFDLKFGSDFIKNVPARPGVYEISDPAGTTIYVGKAKILRRRLQQYRNARRCKKHHKMRAILSEASNIRIIPCPTDLEAVLLENQMIQRLRPKFNVASAFSFLYPMVGLERNGLELKLVYTTSPREFSKFEFYGAFRSRETTREGYFAMIELLEYLGHREPMRKLSNYPRVKFSHLSSFRQLEEKWFHFIDLFLRGESIEFLEQAALALVEKPSARRNAETIQQRLDELKRFFKFEARPLRRALLAGGLQVHSISQQDRDSIFLRWRYALNARSS